MGVLQILNMWVQRGRPALAAFWEGTLLIAKFIGTGGWVRLCEREDLYERGVDLLPGHLVLFLFLVSPNRVPTARLLRCDF